MNRLSTSIRSLLFGTGTVVSGVKFEWELGGCDFTDLFL